MPFVEEWELDPLPAEQPTRGQFVTEDELDPVTPSIWNNPLGALTSADWWLTRPTGEKPPVAQQLAGPFTTALDALTLGFGDEIAAGGSAIIDAFTGGPGYDERLRQAREAESDFRRDQPVASTVLDIGGALRLPINLLPKSPTALGRIKESAKLGGVLGAGYGFGEGEGGLPERALSAGNAAIMSALLGGGIQGVGEGVSGAIRGGKNLVGTITGSRARQQAAEILEEAGGDAIRAMPLKDPNNPLYKFRTTAEATQSPRLAQLEQQVGKKSARANELSNRNKLARQEAQVDLLEKATSGTGHTAERSGTELRQLVADQAEEAFKKSGGFFEEINQQGLVPYSRIRKDITKLAKEEYKAGGMPSSMASIVKKVNEAVEVGGVKSKPKFKEYDFVYDLRERVQQAWKKAKDKQDAKAARIYSQMWRSIDDAVEAAPMSGVEGALSKVDVDRYIQGKKLHAEASNVFREGKIGASLQRVGEGRYLTKDSQLVSRYFDGTPEGMRQLLQALPDSPEARDRARAAFVDHLQRISESAKEVGESGKYQLRPAETLKNIKKYKDALNVSVGDKRLFEPDHLKTLDILADEMALAPGMGKSVKELAFRASEGQPTTAQALLMESAGHSVLQRMGMIGKGIDIILKKANMNKEELMNNLLAEALYDKSFAKMLIEQPNKTTVSKLGKMFKGFGIQIPEKIKAPINYVKAHVKDIATKPAAWSGEVANQQNLAREENHQDEEVASRSFRSSPSRYSATLPQDSRTSGRVAPSGQSDTNRGFLSVQPQVANKLLSSDEEQRPSSSQTQKSEKQLKEAKSPYPLPIRPSSGTDPSSNAFIRKAIEKAYEELDARDNPSKLGDKMAENTKISDIGGKPEREGLYQAVETVESGGNERAVSPKGAKGLMQIMDKTGREWHEILKIKEPYNPYDAAQNKKIGRAYLDWLVDQFKGDTELALAAYNGGIGRVRKAISLAKHLGTKNPTFKDISQYLPRETREYAPKVLSNVEKAVKA